MSDLDLNSLPGQNDSMRSRAEGDREIEDLHEDLLDFPDPAMPLDDVDDLLSEVDIDEEGEPDEHALSLEEQDLAELVREEPLDLLERSALVMELSEDPVRLYEGDRRDRAFETPTVSSGCPPRWRPLVGLNRSPGYILWSVGRFDAAQPLPPCTENS
jgi:hypothetical protein